jgi:hypothetical protein
MNPRPLHDGAGMWNPHHPNMARSAIFGVTSSFDSGFEDVSAMVADCTATMTLLGERLLSIGSNGSCDLVILSLTWIVCFELLCHIKATL